MREVTIEKAQLIATLTENKAKHTKLFGEANTAFYEKVVAKLTDWEQKVARHEMKFYDLVEGINKLQRNKPSDHIDEYQEALDMLGYEVNEVVVLQAHEFTQFVQDKWAWKVGFTASYTENTGRRIA